MTLFSLAVRCWLSLWPWLCSNFSMRCAAGFYLWSVHVWLLAIGRDLFVKHLSVYIDLLLSVVTASSENCRLSTSVPRKHITQINQCMEPGLQTWNVDLAMMLNYYFSSKQSSSTRPYLWKLTASSCSLSLCFSVCRVGLGCTSFPAFRNYFGHAMGRTLLCNGIDAVVVIFCVPRPN